MTLSWPSIPNIHKVKNLSDYLKNSSQARIKLNGCAFSETIFETSNGFEIKTVNTRTQEIYSYLTKEKPLDKLGKIGHIGDIRNLPNIIFPFIVELAKKLNVKELTIYGELYLAKENTITAKYVSFHPYGFYSNILTPDGPEFLSNEIILLIENLFPVSKKFIDFDSFNKYLISSSKYEILLPPCIYEGLIYDGIKFLAKLMYDESEYFEGIVWSCGCKWKRHIHEEQEKIPINVFNESESLYDTYQILSDIHKWSRLKYKEKNDKKLLSKDIDPLIIKINDAFINIVTKKVSITNTEKALRYKLIPEFINDVIEELKIQHINDDIIESEQTITNLEIDWTDKEILKIIKKEITKLIMTY